MTAITGFTAYSAPRAPRSRLRLTTRGRRVLLVLATVPLIVAALVYALNGGGATATDSSGSLEYVTVLPGDSLWSIAEQLAPRSDPRDVIDAIVDANGLTDESVRAGERLAIPAAYGD
ncbi:LysM peptidoglycan-binding domain-containing protein [Galbitalea sp. SE-J8]|uniref:LysM peptidoglycan-binding domain-containing protein n=1 Tax=Galbitalea sp. SE-J8 TaxID=3054952 RepID=UPI00259CE8A7|nr:LysM peptidoglycan-binding domain-containing protein [Galbitalea sp. SE-J8]MDM4762543.1 LysM peptidoglycan-binding domain-containing protein [Galbitalea sp. SE-J8]